MHEFYLIEDGRRALMTQYIRSVYDLCPWGLCDGLGYLQAGLFQEIDVESGDCVFMWSSIEHVGPEESYVLPFSTEISGTGESPELPWDYFHINSVDKSSYDGGYLVSARHVCAIYKVDGTTGEILWRFGGKKNEYAYDNELGDISFGFQHDARWISDGEDESVISFFDNASNGFTETAGHSMGKIVRLDHKAKVARLVERPLDPPFVNGHAHLARSQGNFQLNLPGFKDADVGGQQIGRELGNRIMSFGNDPFFSEYRWNVVRGQATGIELGVWEKVFYGAFAYGYMMNYRVLKFDGWDGVPLTKPALWSFSQHGMNHTADNGNAMTLYVSWNGHTKIDTWTFYGANTEGAKQDLNSYDWLPLVDGFKKRGFETIYRHDQTFVYTYAEAFDEKGRSLGKSLVQDTFTPNKLMAEHYCDELACQFMDTNNPDRQKMREEMQKVYEDWVKAKENNTEDDIEDIYESVYSHIGDGSKGKVGKIIGFVISFFSLGILLGAIIALAMRRFTTVQTSMDKIIAILGIKPRRWEESRKGKYFGIDSDETLADADDDDAEMQRVVSRSSDIDIRGQALKESGLEAERQTFWRPLSP